MQETLETRLEKLKHLIKTNDHIIFFGGAGVSTESGIPDFRSKDGLYNQHDINFEKYQPEYLLSHTCLMKEPKVFYEFYRQKLDFRNTTPNITHRKLAEWESLGKKVSIITQNIDGLHQAAGSKEVYEIHGTTTKNYCTNCGTNFAENAIFDATESIPICPVCKQGHIRPDVTLYEESLPDTFLDAQRLFMNKCLKIVAGTSLTVYPAANLIPRHFDSNLVIINRDETHADNYAGLIFHEELGTIFSKL